MSLSRSTQGNGAYARLPVQRRHKKQLQLRSKKITKGDRILQSKGKSQVVKVFVKSKRIAVSSFVVANYRYPAYLIGSAESYSRVVTYEDRLDEDQEMLVGYAEDLARSLNATLEVINVSKRNILRKFLMSLLGEEHEIPSVVLTVAKSDIRPGIKRKTGRQIYPRHITADSINASFAPKTT